MMHIFTAVCMCRYWPVHASSPMGKCGYCGERPEMVFRDGRYAIWSDGYGDLTTPRQKEAL